MVAGTSDRVDMVDRSTNPGRRVYRPATAHTAARARTVFPTPPGPTRVTILTAPPGRSIEVSAASSASRPISAGPDGCPGSGRDDAVPGWAARIRQARSAGE